MSTNITLHLVFENFPDGAFDTIGGIFSGVAQLPIFLTQSPYLVGAGTILKLVQDIGDALFNGKPNYSPTFTINFSDIGQATEAGYTTYFNEVDDPKADYKNFTFVQNQGLIDPATKKPYNGDAPYFIIAIDGTQRDELKGFAPLVATANTLSTFFNIKDGGTIPIKDVLSIFSAANDVSYGKRALGLKAQIAANPPGTSDQQQELSAYVADIQDPDLAKLFSKA